MKITGKIIAILIIVSVLMLMGAITLGIGALLIKAIEFFFTILMYAL